MLNILLMIILIIILFIIILLLVGIGISFEYNKKGSELKGCLKILIFNKIKIYSLEFPSSKDDNDDEETEDEKKDRDFKKLYEMAKPCFKDLFDYLKTFLRTVKIIKMKNHLIFGMDSFADTGTYIGIIWGILAILNTFDKNMQLSAEPSFTGSVLEGYGENTIKIYPFKLLIPTIRLISIKEVRDLIKGVLDER